MRFLVKASCVTGIFVFLAVLAGTVYISLATGQPFFPAREKRPAVYFPAQLRETDALIEAVLKESQRLRPRSFDARLDSLEYMAAGADAQVSVLKRRRRLAREFAVFAPAYREAALRQNAAYPHSGPLAALAADALLGSGENGALPRMDALAQVIARALPSGDENLAACAFALLALGGSFSSLEETMAIPNVKALFDAGLAETERSGGIAGVERENLLVDAALIAALDSAGDGAGDGVRHGANNVRNDALHYVSMLNPHAVSSRNALVFAAEYSWDFGDPALAATLFLRSGGLDGNARAADALYMAGNTAGARVVWEALAETAATANPAIAARSLYNLAVAAADDSGFSAQETYLTRLFLEAQNAPENERARQSHIYGIIRWTRLLDQSRSAATLAASPFTAETGLLDLELFRRTLGEKPVDRTIADTWLLLERHPQDGEIYRWAAWYFDFLRRYDETAFLMKQAALHGITGSWMTLNDALRAIREGETTEAAALLQRYAEAADGEDWQVQANLGLILEAGRSYKAALENYERSFALLEKKIAALPPQGAANQAVKKAASKEAARVQLRIARCCDFPGRSLEMRAILENALRLDDDNLQVRLALRRLTDRGL
jgi:hypothetical protein